jgi:hypothetical protein
MLSGFAVIPDVLVTHKGETGFVAEVEGRRVFFGAAQVQPGTTVPDVGHRGPVTVRVEALHDVYEAFRRSTTPLTAHFPPRQSW